MYKRQSQTATVLEVRAADRAGLLSTLGQTLAREHVSVRSAHIATHAGQAVDTFYLTDAAGGLLLPAMVGRVITALIEAADGQGGGAGDAVAHVHRGQ